MEVKGTENEQFTLIFPKHVKCQGIDASNNDQRQNFFIGEEFDMCIVAKCVLDPVEKSSELTKWKSLVQAFQPILTTVPTYNSNIENESVEDGYTHCRPLASYKERLKDKWLQLNSTTLLFPLPVSLAGLPDSVSQCKLWVTLWGPPVDLPNQQHLQGMKQCLAAHPDIPDEALQQDGKILQHVVTATIHTLPQPGIRYISSDTPDKCTIVIHVNNPLSSDVCIENLTLQSSNSNQNSDLDVSSPLPVSWPLSLSPMESLTTSYHVDAITLDKVDLEMPVECMMSWQCKKYMQEAMTTRYRLGSVRMRQPPIIITGEPQQQTDVNKPFTVTYTIDNDLQDFLALKLVWSPERSLVDPKVLQSCEAKSKLQDLLHSVICHHPTSQLGPCSRGSKVIVPIEFSVLKPGVYELGQHMKLNLQYYNPSLLSTSLTSGDAARRAPNSRTGSPKHLTQNKPITSSPNQHRRTTSLSPATESSMSHPLQPGYHDYKQTGSKRRGSGAVPQQQTTSPAPTPTDVSPTHAALKGVNIDHFRQFGSPTVRQKYLVPHGQRSVSQATSPLSPKHVLPGPVLPSQVLKRNCMVYVTDSTT